MQNQESLQGSLSKNTLYEAELLSIKHLSFMDNLNSLKKENNPKHKEKHNT